MANIRKANISDANSCAEIVHSWVQATSWMPNRFTLAELESLIEAEMPNREIWVVGNPIFATCRTVVHYHSSRGRLLNF